MDRQSFLSTKYLDESSSGLCGAEDCECGETRLANEKQVFKVTRSFGLAALSVLAFLCTILFTEFKVKADQWLLPKKNSVISCSTYSTFNKSQSTEHNNNNDKRSGDHESINNKDPADKKNGNGCMHQQGVNALCETTGSKRRTFKVHTC